ncbi:MAG TPA: MarR family winged helix-turn-helix transcriptional regulator [Alphaproteobacteria bacterium]|nr:MarR family winged helix-turn-helix transcriptional regulator [Alphaproteobacteria bacterium]
MTPTTAQPDTKGTLELEAFLPYRLSVLANTLSRVIAETYERRFELSVGEWRLLAVLARFGPSSANAVCSRTAMDKVRVSRAVARGVERGLIDRRIDARDRRRSILTLTAEGRDLHDRIVPAALAREAELLAPFTPDDRRCLLDLLAQLQSRATTIEPRLADAAQAHETED